VTTLIWLGFVIAALVAGFVTGMLVMKNNYKRFSGNEDQFRKIILDPSLKAEQKVLHIRNKINI